MFRVASLASGSSGNCYFLETDKGNLLVDAGISAKQIVKRLESMNKRAEDLQGIFLSHEHIDHVRGVRVLSKKYDIPIFANKKTALASNLDLNKVNLIETDEEVYFNGLSILPFSKSHDAADPVSYNITNEKKTVSVITDIGYGCENVIENIKKSDALILESNHDVTMLTNGRYPNSLKQRILGRAGHISNYDSALLVLEHAKKSLQHVLLSHLSRNNNTPLLALTTFHTLLKERKDLSPSIVLAPPFHASESLVLS